MYLNQQKKVMNMTLPLIYLSTFYLHVK